MSAVVPVGWPEVRLDDIAFIVRGVTYQKEDSRHQAAEGLVPILRATNIDRSLVLTDFVFVPAASVRPDQYLRPGDILVATSSGSPKVVGKSALCRFEFVAAFGAFCAVIRAKPGVDPVFLAQYVSSRPVREEWSKRARGTNINNLKREDLASTSIPLPAIEEQSRVVASLDKLISRLEVGLGYVGTAQLRLQRLQRQVLARIPALASNFATAQKCLLGDLVVNYDGRRIPVKASDRAQRSGPYPYYGASGIIDSVDDYLFEGDYLLIAEDGANLVTRSKPIAFPASGRFWVNNHAHAVQPRAGVEMRYLEHYLNGLDISRHVTGSAQPKLTQAAMNKLPITVPDIGAQRVLVDLVEKWLSRVDNGQLLTNQVVRRAESLRSAIHSAAFTGTLVSTDLSLDAVPMLAGSSS